MPAIDLVDVSVDFPIYTAQNAFDPIGSDAPHWRPHPA
jgi:hypothetical protein